MMPHAKYRTPQTADAVLSEISAKVGLPTLQSLGITMAVSQPNATLPAKSCSAFSHQVSSSGSQGSGIHQIVRIHLACAQLADRFCQMCRIRWGFQQVNRFPTAIVRIQRHYHDIRSTPVGDDGDIRIFHHLVDDPLQAIAGVRK
jgi:hypothetical protein